MRGEDRRTPGIRGEGRRRGERREGEGGREEGRIKRREDRRTAGNRGEGEGGERGARGIENGE